MINRGDLERASGRHVDLIPAPPLNRDFTVAEKPAHTLGTSSDTKIYSGIPCLRKYCRARAAAPRLAILMAVPTSLPTTTPRTRAIKSQFQKIDVGPAYRCRYQCVRPGDLDPIVRC